MYRFFNRLLGYLQKGLSGAANLVGRLRGSHPGRWIRTNTDTALSSVGSRVTHIPNTAAGVDYVATAPSGKVVGSGVLDVIRGNRAVGVRVARTVGVASLAVLLVVFLAGMVMEYNDRRRINRGNARPMPAAAV